MNSSGPDGAPAPATPKRFHSLDVLRGVAALSVVFSHWKHFFYDGVHLSADFAATSQPLYPVFRLFYQHGWLAVELFFSLSGFIFYWLYSQTIAERRVSSKEFTALRFSRLYPLHALTLVAVGLGQLAFHQLTSTYFVYPKNDAYHFALQTFFASDWGLQTDYSFNGPIWSVSVEILLYCIFFLACRFVSTRALLSGALAFVGLMVARKTANEDVGRGIMSFFIGGCVFHTYRTLVARGWITRARRLLEPIVPALWIATVLGVYGAWSMDGVPGWERLQPQYHAVVLFPLTILYLAVKETERGSLGKRVAVLGDISYSSYLLHFPLQLLAISLVLLGGLDRSIFLRVPVLVAFFVVLAGLSYASYALFERPAQSFLRGRLLAARERVPQLASQK